jgi:hypothetical protein
MKKLLFIIAIIALPLMAIGQEFVDTLQTVPLNAFYSPEFGYLNQKQAEITYKDSSGFYVIKFVYNDTYCMIPATYPAGCPHYSATITVYEVMDGDTVVIGKPFPGTYTGGKCYEDEPAGLIDQAKKQVENLKMEPAKEGKLQLKPADSIATLSTFGTESLVWNMSTLRDSITPPKPVYDTIPVIMLACDTAKHYTGDLVMYSSEFLRLRDMQPTFWIRGYEVRKISQYWGASYTGSLAMIERNQYDHAAYLDENKKPVKYLVWMSKGVGK